MYKLTPKTNKFTLKLRKILNKRLSFKFSDV